jgi:hypothetical protein
MKYSKDMQEAVQSSSKIIKPVEKAMRYVKSQESKRNYINQLGDFFDFLELPGSDLEERARAFLNMVSHSDNGYIQDCIMSFLNLHKQRVERKEIRPGTLWTYYQSIKVFVDAHDEIADKVRWKRISKSLPTAKKYSNDRTPTTEEIRKIVNNGDRRVKVIVLVMCSSGIRLGAWDYLRWKHVEPKHNDKGEIIAAKLTVYADESDEYYSFVTPECYNAVKDYMDYRGSCGESITGESWVVRDSWQTADKLQGSGLARYPKPLHKNSIKKIIEREWIREGVRTHTLPKNQQRHEFKALHGLRKFFQTHTQQVMNAANVELLMGHELGISSSYYKPREGDLLRDYVKAIPLLTINSDTVDKSVLQSQVVELKEKRQEDNYIIQVYH